MVEIAICLAVIGFALVAIIGVLPIGMNVQKENREETIINFDANYLMSAITSGSFGQDELTNYVIAITNVMTIYNQNRVATNIRTNWYTTVGPTYSSVAAFANRSFLTNGFNIIGLLTIPKYAGYPGGGFVSNYVTADFRATTGSPMDQGNGQASKDFAFSYRVYPEIIPEPSLLNYVNASSGFNAGDPINSNYIVLATNLQANLSEIRLRFRWPVLPGGRLGNGNQVFRTAASGLVGQTSQGLHFILPQSYGINSSPYLLP